MNNEKNKTNWSGCWIPFVCFFGALFGFYSLITVPDSSHLSKVYRNRERSASHIWYKDEPEGEDHWQSPEETERLGTGDCEDSALLLMRNISRETDIEPFLVVIRTEGDSHHAIVKSDGHFIEPKSGVWLNEEETTKNIVYTLSYNQAMRRIDPPKK